MSGGDGIVRQFLQSNTLAAVMHQGFSFERRGDEAESTHVLVPLGEQVRRGTGPGPYQMPTIQLLRYAEGEVALRFCRYSLDGHFRPGLRALLRRLVE